MIRPYQTAAVLAVLFFFSTAYAIETSTGKLDFGPVNEGETVRTSFQITNNSLKPLDAGIRPSCDCISAQPSKIRLEPGQSRDVKVVVETQGYAGKFEKEVYVQSNDAVEPYIKLRIHGQIVGNAAKSGVDAEQPATSAASPTDKTVKIVIFSSPGCGVCKRIESKTIPEYERKSGIKADIRHLSLDDPKNYEMLLELEKRLKRPLNMLPIIYAGGAMYGGKKEILNNIDKIFALSDQDAGIPAVTVPTVVAVPVVLAADKLKLLPILFAGLVDSINPCAFATIVFFLSYMSLVLKKSKLELVLAGTAFIVGVFITYLGVGIGLFNAVLALTNILKYTKVLYTVIGVFLLVLAARHVYEAAVLKKSGNMDDAEVKLKLPGRIREKIEKLITSISGAKYLLPIVFITAVVITLLELVCTGQVYLPAIIYLTSVPEYRLTAYFYLILYCFLFVLPLIVIFAMYYFGLTTLALKRFFKDNIVVMKLTMAVFFITMAVFMFAEVVK